MKDIKFKLYPWGYGDGPNVFEAINHGYSDKDVRHELLTDGQDLSLSINDNVVSKVKLDDKHLEDVAYDKSTNELIFIMDDENEKRINMEDIVDNNVDAIPDDVITQLFNTSKN